MDLKVENLLKQFKEWIVSKKRKVNKITEDKLDKTIFVVPKLDSEKTPRDWVAENCCPTCHAKGSLYEGPSGGGMTNCLCVNCGHKWNIGEGMGFLFVDYIGFDEENWIHLKSQVEKRNAVS